MVTIVKRGAQRKAAAARIREAFEQTLGIALPVEVRCWDGSVSGPDSTATVVFRNRRAIRHVLWSPNELGLVRAYITGDLDIEGDIYALLSLPGLVDRVGGFSLRDIRSVVRSGLSLLAQGGVGLRPRPPVIEVTRGRGLKHSRARDASSVSHHYDVGNEFYALFLGDSMVYSCAYWSGSSATLDEAQHAKLDLVCRKLGLRPGMRLLDVGCGWGAMAVHAARLYDVEVVGITLSREQAEWARAYAAEAGVSDRVEIRLQDYRDVDDAPFDAISSIGMSEHVGDTALPTYAATLYGLLRPEGRLLNHAIAAVTTRPAGEGDKPGLIQNYIFPDGEILPLSRTLDAFEQAGLEVRDSESLREHYALTLRAWVGVLERSWNKAVDSVGEERARTWLLYLVASALGFEEAGRLTIHQVLAVRPSSGGHSGLPRTRAQWLGNLI